MAAYQYVYHMQGVSKTYPGGKKCFENIHLSFLPGVKIGVVGVNGAGKSTLMKIMAGLDKDFQGEAWHAEGARVTAHTFLIEAVGPLLDAGIDCIEHGTGMTPAHMEQAADQGVAVVPTMLQVDRFPEFAALGAARFPEYAAQMLAMHERRLEQVAAMREAGIRLFLGTDAGGGLGHGLVPQEALEWRKAGIPDDEIVAAATWGGREYLGARTLTEGASADLVVYPSDPREDVGVLSSPRAVFLRGERWV